MPACAILAVDVFFPVGFVYLFILCYVVFMALQHNSSFQPKYKYIWVCNICFSFGKIVPSVANFDKIGGPNRNYCAFEKCLGVLCMFFASMMNDEIPCLVASVIILAGNPISYHWR